MGLKVGLLGGGSWGTTVASLVARNTDITLWARDAETVTEINTHHTNSKYLPGASLPDNLYATASLEEAVCDVDVLVMGVPSQGFRSVLEQVKPCLRAWVPVISLTKGGVRPRTASHSLFKKNRLYSSGRGSLLMHPWLFCCQSPLPQTGNRVVS